MSDRFIKVIKLGDMPKSGIHCTEVDGVAVALCRAGDNFYAVANRCTHAESTFDGGRIRGVRLICPLHGAMFDLRDGKPNGQLARAPLQCFETRTSDDGFIEVRVGPV